MEDLHDTTDFKSQFPMQYILLNIITLAIIISIAIGIIIAGAKLASFIYENIF